MMTDSNSSLLDKEELEYISTLMAASDRPERASQASSFKIEGSLQASAMLTTLAANASLSLEAHFEHFSLSFPVRLSEDEFQSQHLELAPPIIYEHGPRLRAWRLPLTRPLSLLDADGGVSALRVHELSHRGLLVDTRPQRQAPEHFHLRLALPSGESMPIEARRVRETTEGLTAYEVDFAEERDAESLRRYLFNQHRRLHPQLQSELPVDLV